MDILKDVCYWPFRSDPYQGLGMFSAEIKRRGYSSGEYWSHLIGKLITCILCGKKAIILRSDWSIPYIFFNSFCFCAISIGTADLSYHWCSEKDAHRIGVDSINPLLIDAWWKSTTLDVTALLESYQNIGYIF